MARHYKTKAFVKYMAALESPGALLSDLSDSHVQKLVGYYTQEYCLNRFLSKKRIECHDEARRLNQIGEYKWLVEAYKDEPSSIVEIKLDQ